MFNIKNNTIQFKEEQTAPVKTYEICLDSDSILKQNGMRGFHEAGENVDKALVQWKKQYENLNQNSQSNDLKNISGALNSAMDAIPEMTEQKRKIDMHVFIASKILQEIKMREIDKLQDFEDEIMKGAALTTQTKTEIQKYLSNKDHIERDGDDVVRLLVLLSICYQDKKYVEQLLLSTKLQEQDLKMLT